MSPGDSPGGHFGSDGHNSTHFKVPSAALSFVLSPTWFIPWNLTHLLLTKGFGWGQGRM